MITRFNDLPDFDDNGNISVREVKGTRYAFLRQVDVRWQVRIARSIVGGVVSARKNSRGEWLSGAAIPREVRDYVLADERGRVVFGPERDPATWEEYVALWNGECGPTRRQRAGSGLKGIIEVPMPRRFTPLPGVRVSISFREPLNDGASDFLPYPFSAKTFRKTVQNLIDTEKDLRGENGIYDEVVCPGCGEKGMETGDEKDGLDCMNCGEHFSDEAINQNPANG